jgi:hypothetical protein
MTRNGETDDNEPGRRDESGEMTHNAELPEPYWWPRPITPEQYLAFTPAKLDLVSGYLIADEDSNRERLELLALLLTNCGLDEAVKLASPEHWRNALEHSYLDW